MLTPAATRHLARLDDAVQQRIRDGLDLLVAGSPSADVQKLAGPGDEYRLRVGEYRVLYGVDKANRTFVVFKIADRKDAYR